MVGHSIRLVSRLCFVVSCSFFIIHYFDDVHNNDLISIVVFRTELIIALIIEFILNFF